MPPVKCQIETRDSESSGTSVNPQKVKEANQGELILSQSKLLEHNAIIELWLKEQIILIFEIKKTLIFEEDGQNVAAGEITVHSDIDQHDWCHRDFIHNVTPSKVTLIHYTCLRSIN